MLDFLGNIFRGNYKVDGFPSEKDGNVGKRTIDDNTLRYIWWGITACPWLYLFVLYMDFYNWRWLQDTYKDWEYFWRLVLGKKSS